MLVVQVKAEEEELYGDDWMAGRFETDVEELRRAKDVNIEDLNSYSIHDRRNPINVCRLPRFSATALRRVMRLG